LLLKVSGRLLPKSNLLEDGLEFINWLFNSLFELMELGEALVSLFVSDPILGQDRVRESN
jgi:hypothetical protein